MPLSCWFVILSTRLFESQCNEESSLDVEKVAEQKPELGCKNRFAVTDDRVREAVILHHHIDNYFRQFSSVDSDLDVKRRSLEISQLIRSQLITTSSSSEGCLVWMDEAQFSHVFGHLLGHV